MTPKPLRPKLLRQKRKKRNIHWKKDRRANVRFANLLNMQMAPRNVVAVISASAHPSTWAVHAVAGIITYPAARNEGDIHIHPPTFSMWSTCTIHRWKREGWSILLRVLACLFEVSWRPLDITAASYHWPTNECQEVGGWKSTYCVVVEKWKYAKQCTRDWIQC